MVICNDKEIMFNGIDVIDIEQNLILHRFNTNVEEKIQKHNKDFLSKVYDIDKDFYQVDFIHLIQHLHSELVLHGKH